VVRNTIFWVHLVSGIVAGVVILIMSFTGVLLTFQSQIVGFANRDYTTVQPPEPGMERMDLDALLLAVGQAEPDLEPTSITLRPDPTEAYVVSFGRAKTVFADPYTGEVRGEGNTAVRDFMREIVYWHRWFAADGNNRVIARAITGACNLVFCLLIATGFYIWWPKKWSLAAFKAVLIPDLKAKGRKRDFNWHNTIAIWCLPVLLLVSISGVVISYRWASNLVYTLTGTELPQSASSASTAVQEDETAPTLRAPLESFVDAAKAKVPDWAYLTLNLPKEGELTTTLSISEMDNRIPLTRSTLTISTSNAEVVKWVPFTGESLGRQARIWLRFIHTGEAAGWIGQLIAGLASAGACILVWTGFSLSWRRYKKWKGPKRQHRAQ